MEDTPSGRLISPSQIERTRPPTFEGSVLAILTFVFLILLFLYSYDIMFSLFQTGIRTQLVYPDFFVFLLHFSSPYSIGIVWVLLIMFALYLVFFISIIRSSSKQGDFRTLDSAFGYFVFISCASMLLSVVIVLIEKGAGIEIGGTGIDTAAQQNPLLGYTSLIYAPFVEELGFRILPLGIFSAVVVGLKARSQSLGSSALKDSLLAIVIPGSMRKKHGIRFSSIDWILIIITSAIFAYAHIYFGGWDWGKFAQTFVFGVLVAIGFLKFGVYVDIPMHWVANGIAGMVFLEESLVLPIGLFLLWILFMGALGVIMIIRYVANNRRRIASAG